MSDHPCAFLAVAHRDSRDGGCMTCHDHSGPVMKLIFDTMEARVCPACFQVMMARIMVAWWDKAVPEYREQKPEQKP